MGGMGARWASSWGMGLEIWRGALMVGRLFRLTLRSDILLRSSDILTALGVQHADVRRVEMLEFSVVPITTRYSVQSPAIQLASYGG